MSKDLLEQSMWAAIAAVAFGVLFNVPRRALPPCALLAAAGFYARGTFMASHGVSLELATLLAAMQSGFLAVGAGKLWHAPALVFAVPAVVPFVPGALALMATQEAVALVTEPVGQDRVTLETLVSQGIRAALVVGAMAGGVAVPSLLFKHRRPLT